MKDIKSMIIGFLLATCMFLFMGATGSDKNVGKYHTYGDANGGSYLLDTQTGESWKWSKIKDKKGMKWNQYWEKKINNKSIGEYRNSND